MYIIDIITIISVDSRLLISLHILMEVSAAIIVDGTKVLCFKKGVSKHDYLTGHYEFPGGKLEPGESPSLALVRELAEELSYVVNVNSLEYYDDVDYDYKDFTVKLHYFFIRDSNPKYELKEHKEAIWVNIDYLNKLEWVGADFMVVKQLMNDYNSGKLETGSS